MRIKEIKIKNYRQYKNLVFSFEKPLDRENDLHVIIARNGVGKSNFLNAITWCLYEEESHLQDKSKALPIVNLDTISSLNDKDEVAVSVEIKVEINNDVHTISRVNNYIKNDALPAKVKRLSSTIMYTKMAYDPSLGYPLPIILRDEEAKLLIEKIFPKGISEYFFFDNEQMNNYFNANAGGTIQRAINVITKIDLMQTVSGRLKNQLQEYRVDLGANNANIKRLQIELENAKKKWDDEQKEFENVCSEIKKADDELNAISEEIRGAENLKVLELERENAQAKLNTLKLNLSEVECQMDAFIVRYFTLINLYKSFKKTLAVIEEKSQKKQLPPEISKRIIEESIKQCECQLCKNKLSDIHLKFVQEQLESFSLSSPSYEILLTVKSKIIEMVNETEQFEVKKTNLLQKMQNIQTEIETISKKIIQIDNDMKVIPNKEELLKKIEKREMLDATKLRLYSSKGTISRNVRLFEEKYNEANRKFTFEVDKQEKNDQKAKKFKATNQLISYLESAEKELIKEIRDEISAKTFENFTNLVWKENTYSAIKIDELYNVDLIHRRGYSAIGSTSAAERALLALSFTNAIHKVSKFESPLVIDSPVGRVSDQNRRRFAEALAEVSKEKQIIMLFTPDEYSDDISVVFDSIAVKSTASMNEAEDQTVIKGV